MKADFFVQAEYQPANAVFLVLPLLLCVCACAALCVNLCPSYGHGRLDASQFCDSSLINDLQFN